MWLSCQSQLHRQTFTSWVDTSPPSPDHDQPRDSVPQIQHNLIIWAVVVEIITIHVSEEPQPSVNCSRANGFFAWPANVSCQNFWDCREGNQRFEFQWKFPHWFIFQGPPTNKLVPSGSSLIHNSILVQHQIRHLESNEMFGFSNQLNDHLYRLFFKFHCSLILPSVKSERVHRRRGELSRIPVPALRAGQVGA